MDTDKLEFLRGTLDVLILKSLVWGPLHGYAITNFILRQSDDALLVEEGTLYPALWRLESKGLLAAEWGHSENNRKAKFYRLTLEGRRSLRQEIRPGRLMPQQSPRCWPRLNCPNRGRPDADDSLLAPLCAILRPESAADVKEELASIYRRRRRSDPPRLVS